MKSKLLLIIFLISFFIAGAQQNPEFKYTIYRDSTGKLYWNKHLPFYIFLAPTPDGENAQKLDSKATAQYANPAYFDAEGLNYIRTHWAVDTNTKKIAEPKQEILWEVYADGLPPYTTIHFTGAPKYSFKGHIVYGKGLKIELKSYDKTSKVRNIFYSLNGEDFKVYKTMLSAPKQGENVIKYLAVDNVGNAGQIRQVTFYVDTAAPSSSSIIAGVALGKKNIISLHTKIYIETKDNLSGVKITYYQLDSLPKRVYTPHTNIPLAALKDGYHRLTFYSVDNVNNIEPKQTFEFYLDRTAPITVSDILGDKFIVNDKIYFSGRTKLKITAVDNKAGVKKVMYSIDNGEFKEYTDPFYMPNEPGWHIVKYFAVDSLENITKDMMNDKYLEYRLKVDKIYVDLTGPSIYYSICGDKYTRSDTVFIGPRTKICISAQDAESGLQYITYSIDGQLRENTYTRPFTLDTLKSGTHKIECFAYDNVNNRNVETFNVILDNKGPRIEYQFSILPIGKRDTLDVYPSDVALFITVQDDLTGVGNIFYSINGGQKLLYKNFIKGFKKGVNTVEIEAVDKLNNKSVRKLKFYVD